MRSVVTTIVYLTLAHNASAHHSRAEFSDEIEIIEGEIVEIWWRNPHPVLTLRVAEQKLAEFDELEDHPMWNCDAVGMPVAMDTALPIEFVNRGNEIPLRIEQNDNTRVFHLADGGRAQSPSPMGHAVALSGARVAERADIREIRRRCR